MLMLKIAEPTKRVENQINRPQLLRFTTCFAFQAPYSIHFPHEDARHYGPHYPRRTLMMRVVRHEHSSILVSDN